MVDYLIGYQKDDGCLPCKYQKNCLEVALILIFYELLVLFCPLIFTKLIVLHYQPLPETVSLVEDIVVDYVTDMVS